MSTPITTDRTVRDVALDNYAIQWQGPPINDPWKPPLRRPVAVDKLIADAGQLSHMQIPVGIIDLPYYQAQHPWVIQLSGAMSSAVIAGAMQTGKSTFMKTLIVSGAVTHSPTDLQFLAIDFSGGQLMQLRELPHVVSVATRNDIARIRRTLAEIKAIAARRSEIMTEHDISNWAQYRSLRATAPADHPARKDPYGDIVLIIENWDTFSTDTWMPTHIRPDHEGFLTTIEDLLHSGADQGIHIVISATRKPAVRGKYFDYLPLRIDLHPAEPTDTAINSTDTRDIPKMPGRAMSNDDNAIATDGKEKRHQHIMIGAPRLDSQNTMDGIEATYTQTIERITQQWTHATPAPKLELLPPKVPISRLLEPLAPLPAGSGHRDRWTLPVGISEANIEPQFISLTGLPSVLLYGKNGSGKTGSLRALARAIMARNTPEQVKFIVIDFRGGLLGVIPDEYLVKMTLPDENGEPSMISMFIRNAMDLARTVPTSEGRPPTIMEVIAQSLNDRRPPRDATLEQLATRSWWSGPDIVLLIDNWHQIYQSHPMHMNALQEFNDFIMSPETGVHVLATCIIAQMQQTTFGGRGPIGTAWSNGCHSFILSGNKSDFTDPSRAFTVTQRPTGQAVYLEGGEYKGITQLAYDETSADLA
ncbi:FtsK/SpoIIIE domain-containing protein [Mycobacteroides abscessus]|uniref:FtsK/SpoIIIE domain-containing protein n=1 Tax=Mycobacteroides abscessus TaxID=36809 RepID=UPI00210414EC|nr:FtsK/SpoIIIE domain-containing protein [Mycobacteroides abscessus]